MPYRRLPNTDKARLRALKAAINQSEHVNIRELPFPIPILSNAKTLLHRFETAHLYYVKCYDEQIKNSAKYQNSAKIARMYITHFIQVLNMAIMRKEIKSSVKALYNLSESSYNLPDITSDASLVIWGKNIVEGERKRIEAGGIPIYNPTIAKVKVHYDIFMSNYENQKALQALTARSLTSLEPLRLQADELILTIWNDVENSYKDVTPNELRLDRCRQYGLIYYYRTGEKQI